MRTFRTSLPRGSRSVLTLPSTGLHAKSRNGVRKDRCRPSLIVLFLAPVAIVTIWEADLHAQVATSVAAEIQKRLAHGPIWTDRRRTEPKRPEPELRGVGTLTKAVGTGKSNGLPERLGQGGRSSSVEVKEVPNVSGPISVPEDKRNPANIAIPENGFPPSGLPSTHRNAQLLERIRKMSKLFPRWPKHPGMQAIELCSYGPAYSSIVVSQKLKVIYVPVFKVGTTSMMWNIAYLENNPFIMNQTLSDPGNRDFYLHEMGGPAWRNHTVFRKSLQEIREIFENPEYLKFGFVRNPFDRIISAYLDKVVQFGPESREYQKQMYGLYGDDLLMRRLRNETKPTFKEYLGAIEQVLQLPRVNHKDFWNKGSFEDNNSRRDLHWRPQIELLHPDLIHFDFVGHFEDIKEDYAVVLNWMYRHTNRRIPDFGQKRLHATSPKDKNRLYADLRKSSELRNMVFRIYEQDFKRFQFPREVPDVCCPRRN